MRRVTLLAAALLATQVGLASADPGVTVTSFDGGVRVWLEGSYPGAYFTVWRSGERAGDYSPLMAEEVLCTGDCFATELDAVPGRTYFYRFDLMLPGQGFVSYGPYEVTLPAVPFAARLWPNPGNGATTVELSLPGGRREAPLEVEARILDLQGRVVRTLHQGPLARGTTPIAWNGRSDSGRPLDAGIYFLRVSSKLGTAVSRVVRLR